VCLIVICVVAEQSFGHEAVEDDPRRPPRGKRVTEFVQQ